MLQDCNVVRGFILDQAPDIDSETVTEFEDAPDESQQEETQVYDHYEYDFAQVSLPAGSFSSKFIV